MENVTLTPKEQSRLQVLNSLAAEHMTLDQAAELMGVTSRHTRRILAAYREHGAAALAHGHRGRRPVNATPEALVVDVAHLARTRYAGVNHTHLAELLAEREGIHIGRTTLRRVLLDAGLSSPRRRRTTRNRRPAQADLPSEGEIDRGRDGRRSRKPGARACRCGQSNGSWASTGPPSGVIWRPEVLPDGSSGWCPIRRHRIPWQRNGVTFSLNTYPDIFPDLRHPVVRFAAALDRREKWQSLV